MIYPPVVVCGGWVPRLTLIWNIKYASIYSDFNAWLSPPGWPSALACPLGWPSPLAWPPGLTQRASLTLKFRLLESGRPKQALLRSTKSFFRIATKYPNFKYQTLKKNLHFSVINFFYALLYITLPPSINRLLFWLGSERDIRHNYSPTSFV